ncbi:endo alpha-1,4 polygalactosaminidase [Paraburkholderia jirisanensis]
MRIAASFWIVSVVVLAGCGGQRAPSTAATASSVVSAPTAASRSATAHWIPGQADTWQWQLSGAINTTYPVHVYDIDLFDAPQSTIDKLTAQGRKVVCYFSAGSAENWRPDYAKFVASDKGKGLDGWAGERWVDTRSVNVRNIMQARLDLAVSKGCNGVEPDNVDGYTNAPGFPLDSSTQADFNLFIARAAHARGLAVALKNDLEQIDTLGASFDFAVNEQCHQVNECAGYDAFVASGKAVFNAEYASKYVQDTKGARNSLCRSARAENIRTLVLPQALDDRLRFSCD